MRTRIAVSASVLLSVLLMGCSNAVPESQVEVTPSGDSVDAKTIASCEEFASLIADMSANGAWLSELSGDTFDDFLENVDTAALSADDDIVRDRMLKFIDELPPNYLLTSGAGLEAFVDLNNDVARACDAARAPIATIKVGS